VERPTSNVQRPTLNQAAPLNVIDLNHILLFIACISPLVLLGQTWRRGGLQRAWRLAALAVLVVTGVAWLITPDTAGFVGGGAWLALLVLPAFGLRKAAELASQQRFASARRLTRALWFLHPADASRAEDELLHALELAERGDISSALSILGPLRNNRTNAGRQATAQSFRLRGEWINLVGWVRSEIPPDVRQTDFALLPLYFRALGETDSRNELVIEFATMASTLTRAQQPAWSYHSSLLLVLAFCGRLPALVNLLETKFRKLPRNLAEFWIGTGELATGGSSAGRARLEKLTATATDQLLRAEATQRLVAANSATPLAPSAAKLLSHIEQSDRPASGVFGSETRPTTAVLIFIGLNLGMFLLEVAMGGSTNSRTLHRLGALEPWAVRVGGEYWRLLTSLFLHYGPLHLLFNLYALFIIGPGLERLLGSVRFGLCYLLSGVGSCLGVLLWRGLDLNRSEQLVGASGCVMGIVGVWAGFLLRHRHQPMAGQRLQNILLIVAIQTAFDLSTPQVSMASHLSGLLSGVALGLLVSPRIES
jgi:rhomboid protease GluP